MANSLPQWMISALNAITPLAQNANRQTHLGFNTAVQGVGNLLGNLAPTPQQDAMHLGTRPGSGPLPPALTHDLGAEQVRNQFSGGLTPLAATFLNQVPVGDIKSGVADLAHKDIHGNPMPQAEYQQTAGYLKSSGYPIRAAYVTRPVDASGNIPGTPEQGHNEHVGGGTNETNENDSGSDVWVVDTPGQPGGNPTQTNLPLNGKQQEALKATLFGAMSDAAGGIDTQRFNMDLGKYMEQNPKLYDDLNYLSLPEWSTASDAEKLKSAHAYLGSKYGAALKNTPIWNHYEGLIK